MHVQRPVSTSLVVRNAVFGPRLAGALLVITGAMLFVASNGSMHQVVDVFVGVTCLGTAFVLWRGHSGHLITLDRRAGFVLVRTQHLLATSSVQHRLADVADVVVERSPLGDGRDLFRPAFVMRNGTHQGWGAYALDHARRDQVTVVLAMREFLGTAASPTAPDGSVAIPRPKTDPAGWEAMSPKQRRIAMTMLVFTLVVSALLFTAGTVLMVQQRHLLTAYRPVPATVQSSDVVTSRDDKGQLLSRPAVHYAYQVDGQQYDTDIVTPLAEQRNGNWARELANSYHPGETVTAYYDPTNPHHAYLRRTWTILPWILMAGSAVFFGFAAMVAVNRIRE
jgi:hypothetical protein